MSRMTRIERWTEEVKYEDGIEVLILKPKEKPKPRPVKKKEEKSDEKGSTLTLMTTEIAASLPTLPEVERRPSEELVAVVRFNHSLYPSWTWLVFGGSPTEDDYQFYGKIFSPDCPTGKLGYFTLSQLESNEITRRGTTFCVERDTTFKPTPNCTNQPLMH